MPIKNHTMPVSTPRPKRSITIVWTDCPACGGRDTCERVRITLKIGNRIVSDHLTGMACDNCGIQEDAELTAEDTRVLFG